MANTDTKESGIYSWMASVRASMANDPCRQLFEDQVQTHAFIFLDDYMEHILAGPKQLPIIELVKTPGRKKNMPRRTRAATAAAAKAKSATLLSLDCDQPTQDVIPVNSFHKALLEDQERSIRQVLHTSKSRFNPSSTSDDSVEKTHDRPKSAQTVDTPATSDSIEPELRTGAVHLDHPSGNPPSKSSIPFPVSERDIGLSVIAEGDESPERSHANYLPLSPLASSFPDWPQSVRDADGYPVADGKLDIYSIDSNQEGPLPDEPHPIPSPVASHHSVPLCAPLEVAPLEAGTSNHTAPLPSRIISNFSGNHERNAFTAPLPVVPVSNLIPQAMLIPLNDSPPKVLPPKGGAVGFPTIPAPSPLRKSVRIVQGAPTDSALPTPAPAPIPLGKRTSWLMKAREAKAMEGPSSGSGSSVAATSTTLTRVSTAVKRKSGEMLGTPIGPDSDRDQRKAKVAKSVEITLPKSTETEKTGEHIVPSVQDDRNALPFTVAAMPADLLESDAMDVDKQRTFLEEGFIDLFKRTVEGLGALTGKNMSKSFGGAAAAALAEARAAAEAKVAERNKVDNQLSGSVALHGGLPDQATFRTRASSDDQPPNTTTSQAEGAEHQLSLSGLAPDVVRRNESDVSARTDQAMDGGTRSNCCNESMSTTPNHSPPMKSGSGFVKPAGPVFNKAPPPPVFMPPASKQPTLPSGRLKDCSSIFPPGHFTLSVAVPLGIPARLTSPSNGLPSLIHGTSQMSAQPPQSSTLADTIVDDRDKVPMWVPPTQDTTYGIDLEPRDVQHPNAVDDDDDDDSWPLEEKLATAEPGWRPFDFSNVDKEDTWSSLPTESQGPTRSLTAEKTGDMVASTKDADAASEANDEEVEQEREVAEISDAERSVAEASEVEEVAEPEMTGLCRAEPIARSTSRISMASTSSSSQSQVGFLSQATKIVNTVLGGGKKVKPELKSLQLAAVAAKKQQEESEKKMQRLRDMEARRQVAIAKKAEEERIRLLEEEKKVKEESDRRKREREENTDKRPLKLPLFTKKPEDEVSKKRKLAQEVEKKPETKKVPSKDKKDLAPPITKSVVTPAMKLAAQRGVKVATTALALSAACNATQNAPPVPAAKPIGPEAKPFKVVPSSLKGKTKAKLQEDDTGDKLPATMVQSQMAARAKAQMQAAKLPTPEIASESIELPEINSEYSDSEDGDRVRTFDPPDWAQSPELRQALEMQSTVNPDDVFGTIRPLRMEEMFRTRQSRFRARTSSANWSGSDRLTVEEIREYERRMGFQQTRM